MCADFVAHRNVKIQIGEYLSMIDHLINQCKRHFDEEVKIEDPRKYFDDAIIQLRIKKNGSVET